MILTNLVSFGVVLLVVFFWLALKGPTGFGERDPGEGEAIAAVARPARLPARDGGSGDPTADSVEGGLQKASATTGQPPGKQEKADDEGGGAAAAPIDLAIAPDGGVPYHPEGTPFRSPFAKPNATQPLKIKVGFLLNSVDDYDIKTGTFDADFFVSLTSSSVMPTISLHSPNGKIENTEIIADKATFKLYRINGAFKSPPDLRSYPFDSQELKIVLEDDSRGIDQLRLVADKNRTQLARGFRALGWQVSFVEARALTQSYPDRFEGDDLYYGRYVFSLGVERYATSAAFKVFVPAFVIVIIALLGMWVPPEEMEVRSNSGAPMLAGAVLFHFALMQELPATMYLTRADKLMSGVYISLALGMISTWWMFLVKEDNMAIVFRVARWLVPMLTVVVMGLACWL